jgi:8-oxo-dGTP diphosphatase
LQARLRDWQPELIGTLMFVVDEPRVLLIEKKTGHGAGKVNAPGGKLEVGESPLECAAREAYEEVGVRVTGARLAAQLKFVDTHGPQWFGYAFVAREFSGAPCETLEARPFWCELDALPFARMWEDDRVWLPLILPTAEAVQISEDQQVAGEFLFKRGKLLAHRCYVRSAGCE